MKRCPFCSEEVIIGICDDEGNLRNSAYENDPYSGLTFVILHEWTDKNECPIATHEDEILGTRLYESREELINSWNTRKS